MSPLSTSAWWPEDRAWCVATEPDCCDSYVGGSAAVVAALLADRRLDAVEVLPETATQPLRGTVFVSVDEDGSWSASWQRGGAELEIDDFEGDRDSCLAWALVQPALLRLVRWPGAEEYVALHAEPA
jgi:hypothetical protein